MIGNEAPETKRIVVAILKVLSDSQELPGNLLLQ